MMYMALSDTTVRLARATGTDYTLGDADGLALFVTAQGSKSWHFRFCWGGKQLRISLGIYPEISLRDARTRRDEARNLVAKGIDPRVHRRQERAAAAAATAEISMPSTVTGIPSTSVSNGRARLSPIVA